MPDNKSPLASTFLGSAISGGVNLAQSALQQRWNRQNAQDAYNRQLDFWNKQNEYNTPSAQRQRLEQAGFNPNAQMGALSSGAAEQLSAVPQAESSTMQPFSLDTSLGLMQSNAQMMQSESDYFQAQYKSLNESLEVIREQARQLKLDNEKMRIYLKEFPQLIKNEVRNGQLRNWREQVGLSEDQRNYFYGGMLLPLKVAGAKLDIKQTESIIRQTETATGLMPYNAKTDRMNAEANKTSASSSWKTAQALEKLYSHQSQLFDSQALYNLQNADLLGLEIQRMTFGNSKLEEQWNETLKNNRNHRNNNTTRSIMLGVQTGVNVFSAFTGMPTLSGKTPSMMSTY